MRFVICKTQPIRMEMNMQDHDYQPDAKLDAMLDDLLSADRVDGGIPSGLDARIVAALPLHTLQGKREVKVEPAVKVEHAVIGRIGFFSSVAVRRFAAAVLVVMGIGAMILGLGALQNSKLASDLEIKRIAAEKAAQQLAMAKLTSDIEQAPLTFAAARELHNTTFSTTESSLDRSIDSLKSRTDHASLTAAVDSWSSVAQSLEAELDALEADGSQG